MDEVFALYLCLKLDPQLEISLNWKIWGAYMHFNVQLSISITWLKSDSYMQDGYWFYQYKQWDVPHVSLSTDSNLWTRIFEKLNPAWSVTLMEAAFIWSV